jgi:hypothetical protein
VVGDERRLLRRVRVALREVDDVARIGNRMVGDGDVARGSDGRRAVADGHDDVVRTDTLGADGGRQRPAAHDHRVQELDRHVPGVRTGPAVADGQQPPTTIEGCGDLDGRRDQRCCVHRSDRTARSTI